MFDINGGEVIVLGAVAVVVLGPERLPQYAAQLGRLVRDARSFARKAREQVRSEMGEDFDQIDWEAMDPRRYDPRRIVRDALLDDDGPSDSAPHVPAPMRPADQAADEATDEAADAFDTGPSGTGPVSARPASPYDVDAT